MSQPIFKVAHLDAMWHTFRRWLWILDKLQTIAMIEEQNFDIRTTMGDFLDCIDPDINVLLKDLPKITTKAATSGCGDEIAAELGIPIVTNGYRDSPL